MPDPRLYKDLSWTWPIISPPEDYNPEGRQFREEIIKHSKFKPQTLLTLGCGGGHNDWALKEHFYITGTDISEDMLSLARKLNPECTYLKGDMRTLRLDKVFDAVIATDAISYMATSEDLRAAFDTAYGHLRPGGVFCTYPDEVAETFDPSSMKACTRSKDGVEITLVETYNPPKGTAYRCDFEFIIKSEGKVEIQRDTHTLGLFPKQVWLRLLGEAGFEVHETLLVNDLLPFFACLK